MSAAECAATTVQALDARIIDPTRRDEPDHGLHPAPIRQRIESILRTCKDLLGLERHGATSPPLPSHLELARQEALVGRP
jgi:hypothetical protein